MAKKREGMEAQLFEEYKKKMNLIMEYTVLNGTIDEQGEENAEGSEPQGGPTPDPQAMDGQPPMGGPQQGPTPAPDQNMQPDMNMPPQGGGMDMGQQGPQGFNPQEPDITPGDFDGAEQPTENDDVVDITELTDAQKKTDKEIEELGNKFSEIVKTLNSFTEFIQGNDKKIDDLRAEIEKRNPTQIEKLSMNTAKGGPFTISPDKYWDKKEKESNYSREDDNNGKGQGQYVITVDDANGAVDWSQIAKTLDGRNDNFIWHQTLNEALKFTDDDSCRPKGGKSKRMVSESYEEDMIAKYGEPPYSLSYRYEPCNLECNDVNDLEDFMLDAEAHYSSTHGECGKASIYNKDGEEIFSIG